MKKLNLLILMMLLPTVVLVSCGEKGIVETIAQNYDQGIEEVEKAKSVDDVQRIYNEVNTKVEELKMSHLKEMAALDSSVNAIDNAKDIFTKACCIKASSFNGYIKDMEGMMIAVNKEGIVVPLECIEGDDGLGPDNFCISGVTPIYEEYKSENNYYSNKPYKRIRYLTFQNENGDIIYDDEDAEQYYQQYLPLFFYAHRICYNQNEVVGSEACKILDYLEKNMTEVLNNLPLDESYPEDVREYVNKRYYDAKDYVNTLSITHTGYGFIECTYYYRRYSNEPRTFRIIRDEAHNGRLVEKYNW